ncbi:MAG: hypothetical protein MJ025_00505 [Victivallaceae bacterium]|nr:hypothetical protein [Victivallaceae bacterium]
MYDFSKIFNLLTCIAGGTTIAFFLSLCGTRIAISLLPKLGFIDCPGGRHIHATPTPRGGGVAVVLSFLATFTIWEFLFGDFGKGYWQFTLPVLLLAAEGFIDDKFDLPALVKLAVQVVVGATFAFLSGQKLMLGGHLAPMWLAYTTTVIWTIIIINAFNLIDGVDGLACGIAIISAASLGTWHLATHDVAKAAIMFMLIGCCLGFLRYNLHPARIFLGDVGSNFIGFMFASTSLTNVDRTVTWTSLLISLLACGMPIMDVLLAIWRRTVRKLLEPRNASGIMSGDQDHIHHRLLRRMHDISHATWLLYAIGCVFAGLSLMLVFWHSAAPGLLAAIVISCLAVMLRGLAVTEVLDSSRLIQAGLKRPAWRMLFNAAHPCFDVFAVVVAAYASAFLFGVRANISLIACMVVPVVVALFVSGTYKVMWLRSGMGNILNLRTAMIAGAVLSGISVWTFVPEVAPQRLLFFAAWMLMFFMLSSFVIVNERLMVKYAESYWICHEESVAASDAHKIVVYGAGMLSKLFIDYHYSARMGHVNRGTIIGIVDDDATLTGMKVNGFDVLGTGSDLPAIHEQIGFSQLIVAFPHAQKLDLIRDFCVTNGVVMTVFEIGIHDDETTTRNH